MAYGLGPASLGKEPGGQATTGSYHQDHPDDNRQE
jgi:hypothetical protein